MNTSDFLKRWRDLRARLGDTQGEFGRRLNLTRAYTSQIENGKVHPSQKVINALNRLELQLNASSAVHTLETVSGRSAAAEPKPEKRSHSVVTEPQITYGLFTGPPPVNVLLPFIVQQCQILLQQGRTLRPAERSVHFSTLVNYVEMAKSSAKAGHWDETK